MSLPDLPDLLARAVDGEEVAARVDLGGEDLLVVTPTRTLVYRADGLLSDESVEEYPHDVERIDVSKGRRKAKLTLEYGLDGTETISVPTSRLDDALHPVLAGVLSASGVTDPGESVLKTFRFSELTLIVTSDRLVKHIGSATWDEEYEEFHYADVTDIHFEEGTVATSIVLTLDDRQERVKAPNETERELREALSNAICEYHDVGSVAEFRLKMEEEAAEAEGASDTATADDPTDFGNGPSPLSASPTTTGAADTSEDPLPSEGEPEPEAAQGDAITTDGPAGGTKDGPEGGTKDAPAGGTADGTAAEASRTDDPSASADSASAGSASSDSLAEAPGEEVARGTAAADPEDAFDKTGFEPAGVEGDELADEVAALRETVEAQSAQLDRQAELIETLIEELRRGR